MLDSIKHHNVEFSAGPWILLVFMNALLQWMCLCLHALQIVNGP